MVSLAKELECMGMMFINDPGKTPLSNFIDVSKLDFSIASLNEVDNYLENIRKKQKSLNNQELMLVVIRSGTYLGETIIRYNPKEFKWITYDDAYKIEKDFMKQLGKSLGTAYVLLKKPKTLLFPLAKPIKFLQEGKTESLRGFARLAIEDI
jgi:hypothetical protein